MERTSNKHYTLSHTQDSSLDFQDFHQLVLDTGEM